MRASAITATIHDGIAVLSKLLKDDEYLQRVQDVATVLIRALGSGHKVLFFGNGGSAADAQHIAAELTGYFLHDRQGLASIALTSNTSVLTAIANDRSFDEVFGRQVEAIGSAGDVAFGISTSGESKNVLLAVEVARRKKLLTVGLTGNRNCRLREIVDYCISVPSAQVPRIQEAHILTGHIICELVEQEFLPETPSSGRSILPVHQAGRKG